MTNAVEECVDEICLEGLDGITIPTLWLRLGDRRPTFDLPLDDDDVKSYLWGCLCTLPELDFYVMPEERCDVILWDRFKEVQEEGDINFDKQDDKYIDLYPVKIIDEDGIKGSCQMYKTRKKVTDQIRNDDGAIMSLAEVLEKWGRKVVIVGSQERREEALLHGVDLKSPLDARQYAVLERIGRGRWNGEVTHGTSNLLAVIKDSRSLFYVRKALQRMHSITVQSFGIRNSQGKMVSSKCIHLYRYGRERKTMAQVRLEALTRLLNSKPQKRALLSHVREEMGVDTRLFKKLMDFGKKHVESKLIPYISMYPDAKHSEYMYKGGTSERYLRVLHLIKMYHSNAEEREEEGEAEEEDEEESLGEDLPKKPRYLEVSIIQQGYEVLLEQMTNGVSEQQMARCLALTKLEGRGLCRDLARLKLTVTMMKDIGRCRVKVNICDHLAKTSKLHEQIQTEKSKMLQNMGAEGNDAVLKSLSDAGLHRTKKDPAIVKIDRRSRAEPKSPLTYRILRRTNIILKHVQENRLINNMLWLRKKVDEDCQNESLNDDRKFTPFDKKGLWRLLSVLDEEKQIRLIRKKVTSGDKSKEVMFVCEPNMADDDPLVFAAVDSAKMRMVALSKGSLERSEEMKRVQEDDQVTPTHDLLKIPPKLTEMIYDAQAGVRYGFQSRMNRCKLTHQLLFYQVYDYCNKQEAASASLDPYNIVDSSYEVTEEKDSEDIYDTKSLKVYVDDLTFRRFIPPLRTYSGYENGWCLLGDILLHMPVYVFCQIIRVNFKIPALEDFLKHPVRRLVPVSTLPPFIRQQLLFHRKFLHCFFALCMSLAEMGLLSVGKRNYREKEQVFLYVHRNATLYDTTNLEVSPSDWPEKRFHMKNFHDVNHYWFTLNYICMNTPDDIVKYCVGNIRSKTSERAVKFERAYLEYTPDSVRDDGHLPGDHLGAGGLDSSNWCHLRKNWVKEKNHNEGPVSTPLTTVNPARKRAIKKEDPDKGETPAKKAKIAGKVKKEQDKSAEKAKGAEKTKSTDKTKSRKRKASESAGGKSGGKGKTKGSSSKFRVFVPAEGDENGQPVCAEKKVDSAEKVEEEKAQSSEEKPYLKVDSVRGQVSDFEKKRREKIAMRKKDRPEKIRKPRRRAAAPKERKKYADQKDMDALRRMTKFRVKWSVQEDSCLLLFHVAAKILGGTDRRALLTGLLLRDFLHDNFTESLDKTTKACLRRLHYIMKNPSTVANVNMYLGEALTDKELMKDVKPQRSFKVCDIVQTNKAITDLVQKLREKFKDQGVRVRVELPDTLDEISQRFYISQVVETLQFEEPLKVEDIEKGVLNHLIHAALLLSEKSNYTPILYNVLETYPEKALLDVLAQMKRNFMITKVKRKEVTKDSSLPNGNLGIYQLAQRYSYKWLSKFPRSLFEESFNHMRKIYTENMECYAPEGLGVPTVEKHGFVAALVSLVAQKKVAFQITLPENILIGHPSEVSLRRKLREKEKLICQKTESDEEEEALIEGLEQKTRNPPLCSRRSISNLRYLAQMSARKNMINCPTSDYVMVRCAINFKPLSKMKKPSTLNAKPKNNYEADEILRQHNSTKTFLHQKSGQWIFRQKNGSQPLNLDPDEKWALLSSEKFGLDKRQIKVCQQIFDQLDEAEELGVTYVKLWMTHGHSPSFDRCISALQETKLILSVGVYERKYVSHAHAHPWIVRSYKNLDKDGTSKASEVQTETEEEQEEEEGEELEDVSDSEDDLPQDLWITKPTRDSREVGFLWKGLSVMYEDNPEPLEEEEKEEEKEEQKEEDPVEGSSRMNQGDEEDGPEYQEMDMTEASPTGEEQREGVDAIMTAAEAANQSEIEMAPIVQSPEEEITISQDDTLGPPQTPLKDSPFKTPVKQLSAAIELSSSLILTPPAPGKVLELSFKDGKLFQTVTEKEDSAEQSTDEANAETQDQGISTSAPFAISQIPTSNASLMQVVASLSHELASSHIPSSPRKSVESVHKPKTPLARVVPETSSEMSATVSATPESSSVRASAGEVQTHVQSSTSGTPVATTTQPSQTGLLETPTQSQKAPSLPPSASKLPPGLRPVATIPLGRHDKPVRFVLPASSLKTLMQSGSSNLYDHIKAITTALQKETTTTSQESTIPQNVVTSAPPLPSMPSMPVPAVPLMPPIIGQMGRPAFRMSAPLAPPFPRAAGVRVRLPKSNIPPPLPPTSTATSSGLKIRLPRLGSLKTPDIPKLDDTPLSPPPVADASAHLKSPTGTKSIDAINAVIQNAANLLLPANQRSLIKPRLTSPEPQVSLAPTPVEPPRTLDLSAPPRSPRRMQKTAVRRSLEAGIGLITKAGQDKLVAASRDPSKNVTPSKPGPEILHQPTTVAPQSVASSSAMQSPISTVQSSVARALSTPTASPRLVSPSSNVSALQRLSAGGRVVSVMKPDLIRQLMKGKSPGGGIPLSLTPTTPVASTAAGITKPVNPSAQSLSAVTPKGKMRGDPAAPSPSAETPQIKMALSTPSHTALTPKAKMAANLSTPTSVAIPQGKVTAGVSTPSPAALTPKAKMAADQSRQPFSAITPKGTSSAASKAIKSPAVQSSLPSTPAVNFSATTVNLVESLLNPSQSAGVKKKATPKPRKKSAPIVGPQQAAAIINVPKVVISHDDTSSEVKMEAGATPSQEVTSAKKRVRKKPPPKKTPMKPSTPVREGVKEETRAKLQSMLSKNLTSKILAKGQSEAMSSPVKMEHTSIQSPSAGNATTTAAFAGPPTTLVGNAPMTVLSPAAFASPPATIVGPPAFTSPPASFAGAPAVSELPIAPSEVPSSSLPQTVITNILPSKAGPSAYKSPPAASMIPGKEPQMKTQGSSSISQSVVTNITSTPQPKVIPKKTTVSPAAAVKFSTPKARPKASPQAVTKVVSVGKAASVTTSALKSTPKPAPKVDMPASSPAAKVPSTPKAGPSARASPADTPKTPTATIETPASGEQSASVQDKIKQMLIAGGLAKTNTPIKFNIPKGLNLAGLKFNVVTASEARKMGLFNEGGKSATEKKAADSEKQEAPSTSGSTAKDKETTDANKEDAANEDDSIPQYDGADDEKPKPKKRRRVSGTEKKKNATNKNVQIEDGEKGSAAGEPQGNEPSEEPMDVSNSASVEPVPRDEGKKQEEEQDKEEDEEESANDKKEEEISGKKEEEKEEEKEGVSTKKGKAHQNVSSGEGERPDVSTSEGETPRRKRRKKGPQRALTPIEMPALSFKSLERVNIIPRPWIKPDGDPNETPLLDMMEAILMYLMSKPGVTHPVLISKYKSVLQPIALLEILETLEKIGCVRTEWVTGSHDCTLFSERPEYKTESCGPIHKASFFPEINCPVRMGHFKHLVEKQKSRK